MKQVFRFLMRLYPMDHHELLGDEMLQVFEQAAEEQRARGFLALARFAAAELIGLVVGSVSARRRFRRRERAIDLRRMRPPEVSQESYSAAIDEVVAARRRVAANLSCMQNAIARHQFVQARFYSDEEHKARRELRLVLQKYRIAE
jgi:hypothetical protein